MQTEFFCSSGEIHFLFTFEASPCCGSEAEYLLPSLSENQIKLSFGPLELVTFFNS